MLAESLASPEEEIKKGKISEKFVAVSVLCLPLPHLPSCRLCANKANQPRTKCAQRSSTKITGFAAYLPQLWLARLLEVPTFRGVTWFFL